MFSRLLSLLPGPFRYTLILRLFGLRQVFLIWWLAPRVLQLDSERTEIVLPLNRRSRNHLGSMYFGAR